MASIHAGQDSIPASDAPAHVCVEEYVAQAKRQLDAFVTQWHRQRQLAPSIYASQQTEDQWRQQELAARFGHVESQP
jgi:multidrug resistance efflux pump